MRYFNGKKLGELGENFLPNSHNQQIYINNITRENFMSQIDNVVSWLLNIFFGWRRYRVKFVYKEPNGRISFDFYRTVAVRHAKFIGHGRYLKRELYTWVSKSKVIK
jgi:hypothetical protein